CQNTTCDLARIRLFRRDTIPGPQPSTKPGRSRLPPAQAGVMHGYLQASGPYHGPVDSLSWLITRQRGPLSLESTMKYAILPIVIAAAAIGLETARSPSS